MALKEHLKELKIKELLVQYVELGWAYNYLIWVGDFELRPLWVLGKPKSLNWVGPKMLAQLGMGWPIVK